MTGNPGHKRRRLVSDSTVRRERGLLQSIFERAIDEGHDIRNPFRGIKRGKDKPRKGGKTKPLKEWGLKDYLDVAKELGWIRQSAKDVGQVLRDYRNYIHPEKEFSHGISVDGQDTAMFISVFSSIADQIIASVK
jgi:hypothetical protein